jgi:hypothetical protein
MTARPLTSGEAASLKPENAVVDCRGARLYCNWIPSKEAPVDA